MVVLLFEFYKFVLVQIFMVVLFHRETTLSLHMSMWKIRNHFCLMLLHLLVDLHTRCDLIVVVPNSVDTCVGLLVTKGASCIC